MAERRMQSHENTRCPYAEQQDGDEMVTYFVGSHVVLYWCESRCAVCTDAEDIAL
jgi:hypothetical protein